MDKTSGGSVTRTVTYYPVAGAMRINSTLYYSLKDHLGSASVVTDASGNFLGENRYYPYGETRLTTGTISTDKLFTGQREMAGLGIYHYNARFYSPTLGRFLSADTIVPGAANPQAWNRYAYTLNNPIRYTDPTGHMVDDDSDAGCQNLHQCKKDYLRRRASEVVKSLKNKTDRNDLKAMADIIDFGATLFKDYDELIPVLSGIFLGTEESNSLTLLNATNADRCAAVGRSVDDCAANAEYGWFGDAGFDKDFQDGFSQPFHLWAYIATAANTEGKGPASYLPGMGINIIGNVWHEIIDPDGAGATWQDFALAVAGSNIGTLVNIGAVPPDQLGNTIQAYVGTDGPGAPWVRPLRFLDPLEGN